jgi:hypothetical protein
MSLYCLVIKGEVMSDATGLPGSYKNISNFYYLPADQVIDLSWAGYEGEGFWPAIIDATPDYSINQKLEKVFTANGSGAFMGSKTVTISFNIVTLSQSEYDTRINSLEAQIRVIRDNYLRLTDFTQLADAPISTEAKSDFITFRQQLRDILDNVTDPTTIVWPIIPTSATNITIPPFPPVPTYKNGLSIPL